MQNDTQRRTPFHLRYTPLDHYRPEELSGRRADANEQRAQGRRLSRLISFIALAGAVGVSFGIYSRNHVATGDHTIPGISPSPNAMEADHSATPAPTPLATQNIQQAGQR